MLAWPYRMLGWARGWRCCDRAFESLQAVGVGEVASDCGGVVSEVIMLGAGVR